jgi:four helix bundle protein
MSICRYCEVSGVGGRVSGTEVDVSVSSYRDLEVWQKAMDLVVNIYSLAKSFPDSERFGLTSQIQRAVVSIPSNIAEGHGRHGLREYLNHLSMAYGSLMEVETQIQIADRLSYSEKSQVQTLLSDTQQLGRMLNGLKRSLRSKLDN